jgi:hypothetical protein
MTDEQDAETPKAATPPAAPPPAVTPPDAVGSIPATASTGLDPLVPTVVAPPADYSQAGVPSLDFVRDKIEGRYAHSLGATELAEETPEAKSFAEQAAKREEAAKDKLDAIRRSLRGDPPS